ncbi:hypothetical protein [Anaerolinea sp.]|nr:hypothetical protein [Anaerolinea sp.]
MRKQFFLPVFLCGLMLLSALACRFLPFQKSDSPLLSPTPSSANTFFSATAPRASKTPPVAALPLSPERFTETPVPTVETLPTPQENLPLPAGGCPENSGKIVFSYDPRDAPSVGYGIYLMDSDGSHRLRLSAEDALTDSQPAWSPEHCRIAFVRFNHEGSDDIFLMSADGGSVLQITRHPARDTFPDWSPDGMQISFISDRDGSRNLFVMDVNGEHVRQLTDAQSLPRSEKGYVQWQQWSPDGEEIAFTYNAGDGQGTSIYLIRPDGSGLRKLASRAAEPVWSPDGSQIYFFSNLTGQVEIWRIRRDGSGLQQVSSLYPQVNVDHSLRISPDGAQLAFYGVGPEVAEYGTEIYVLNIDGSNLRSITLSQGQEEWLDW